MQRVYVIVNGLQVMLNSMLQDINAVIGIIQINWQQHELQNDLKLNYIEWKIFGLETVESMKQFQGIL